MGTVPGLARATARRLGGVLAGLVVVTALGLGAALAAFTAAWRTDHAFPDYLRRAEVGELVVNPSLVTDRAEELIASTPGVLDVVSDSFLLATPDDGGPRTRADVEQGGATLQVRASADGRYRERDRPVVHQGRMVDSGAEAFLSLDAATALGLEVGDELPLSFWSPSFTFTEGGDPGEVVETIGRTRVEVVGIGVFADEVLADELYPRQRLLVTPEVAAPFDCTPAHPPAVGSPPLDELIALLSPPSCALTYRYFSLRVAGGEDGVGEVTTALLERFNAENTRLPQVMRDLDIGFFLVPTLMRDEQQRVQQSLAPSVTALRLFGLASAASVAGVAGLVALRGLRRGRTDLRVWEQLGVTRFQRAAATALPLSAAAVVGVAGALGVAWLASRLGPVASARTLAPEAGFGVPAAVTALVLGPSSVVFLAGAVLASWFSSGPEPPPRRRRSPLADAIARRGRVAPTLGARAALDTSHGLGGRALVAGTVLSVGAVMSTVVFSTSLESLVATPERYGWPYDAGVMVGFGYGGMDREAIASSLARPEVTTWGLASLSPVELGGESVPAIASGDGFEDLTIDVVQGRWPAGDDEIALGARTAADLELAVGDTTTVATEYGSREATVTGLAVLPALGPFLAERVSLGTGALLPEAFVDALVAPAEEAVGAPAGTFGDSSSSFVAIDLADGVDAAAFLDQLADELASWDVSGLQPFVYSDAVRPPQITDVAAMRSAPTVLAGLLTSAMALALALGIGFAARARRRELALMRALGCSGAQLRASVRWHAVIVVGIGLAVGTPLGLALGASSWRAFAGDLGVESTPTLSLGWPSVMAAVAFGLAVVVATPTGRVAARLSPATLLRAR